MHVLSLEKERKCVLCTMATPRCLITAAMNDQITVTQKEIA